MATMLAMDEAATTALWRTFDQVRPHLQRQFQDTVYDPETGLPPEELWAVAEEILRTQAGEPRVLQKARLYELVATQGQIAFDPHDWFVDKLNHGNLLRRVGERWMHQAASGPIAQEASWFRLTWQAGLVKGGLDTGHISPGWQVLFSAGLQGLIEQAQQERTHLGQRMTPEQSAFYDAVEMVYRATMVLAGRFAALARRLAESEPHAAPRLHIVAQACDQVPAHAPRTFHQALQFHWLMHELIEMEGELVRSAGHLDRTFYPYYRADIDAGRLTPEQATELLKFFWIKHFARTQGSRNGKNFLFGGQDAEGNDATNELTYVALQAYEELNTPDPKLSARFFPGTPDRFYHRVADLIRGGHNSFVLMNDVPAVDGLLKRGKTLQDARIYLPIGCYEPAVEGKEAACTMNLVVNLAKILELALHDGQDPLTGEQFGPHTGDPRLFSSFEEMYGAYLAQMSYILERSAAYVRAHERQWPQINPSPLIAGTIADCLAQGKDIGQGGAHYNAVGCVGMALANVSDALLAIEQAVFQEGHCTMADLLAALDADFHGYEPLRQYLLHRVPKWGNNDPVSDALTRRIADDYCNKVHTLHNARGGPLQAALFSLDYQWTMGQATGALPDGRQARQALAPGVGSAPGRDQRGATALLNSVSTLDFAQTPNGTVLDVMLHPSAVRGEAGLEAFVSLIKTFFARGGYALQCNVLDEQTLREAQRDPERYASLQIRVTGWSVFFVTLPKEQQEQFIARNIHHLS